MSEERIAQSVFNRVHTTIPALVKQCKLTARDRGRSLVAAEDVKTVAGFLTADPIEVGAVATVLLNALATER